MTIADENMRGNAHSPSSGKKRKHEGDNEDMVDTPSLPAISNLPAFNLTGGPSIGAKEGKVAEDEGDWQIVNRRPTKKAKKLPKSNSSNYPAINFSSTESRLQSQLRISDLQSMVLYILADGPAPTFVSIRHRPEIRKVVVLMVPGLELDMFTWKKKQPKEQAKDNRSYHSPDDFYPTKLRVESLPDSLKPFAEMFEHIWPVKTPGDEKYSKMHSPLHAMLTAPTPKDKEEKKMNRGRKGAVPVKETHGWKNIRVPIHEYLLSLEELQENEYTVHPAMFDTQELKSASLEYRRTQGTSEADGWVNTLVENLDQGNPPDDEIQAGSITAGREVLAMDCEMCMTGEGEFSLTRISIVSWDGSLVMDELVKPAKPITNYLTQYSGITEEMLVPINTTLQDIQKKLLKILHPRTILLGHSLNSDLNALKLTHPFIIDTSVLYPHPRGHPLKSSLKWLAQRYLGREVQKGHGTVGVGAGHDSTEDARTCLDLVKQKCEKGKEWGAGESQGENIFKRVARAGVRYKNQGGSAIASPMGGKSSAAVDWGDPKKGPGGGATFSIGCHSDEEVKEGIIRAVKGDHDGKEIPGGGVDFIWARLRELEALKGWWNNNKSVGHEDSLKEAAPIGEKSGLEAKSVKPAAANPFSAASATTSNPFTSLSNPFTKGSSPSITPIALPVEEAPVTEAPADVAMVEPEPQTTAESSVLDETTAQLTSRIKQIYDSLPPCTAFVIYSGSGDPREMSRLQAMQSLFKKEYKIKKWDQLSVKWTDTEEQALKAAARKARDGCAFMCVK